MKIGLVIGRFQVPELTIGHEYLLETACGLTDKLIVLIGKSEAQTKRNPLSYEIRERMIEDYFKSVNLKSQPGSIVILPLNDHPDDKKWAESIHEILMNAGGWGRQVFVFGGRDSCLDIYRANGGQGAIIHLDSPHSISGTKVRENLPIFHNSDFRAGMIYKSQSEFPRAYPVVDVVVWERRIELGTTYKETFKLLLARKPTDDEGKWRFIGGFVDPTDTSLEFAVNREVREEAGIEVGPKAYVGSLNIDDWRYRKGEEKVVSAIFSAQHIFGAPNAKDDICDLKWFTIDEAKNVIHPVHQPILNLYLAKNSL
jgi:bifunctional NMN adenylyltransferase/nudix hydrolase